ncbi:maleylpyruvate isomerase family mycothiol-dependent enzyme [Glutamicibacter sp.]|uniref:maleylpyruvate isomerase family mycothiol-dependent enzyme n=1 Tax=Glutamicibacter sp. TaxID=1931995 RepID=UPI0028BE5AA4|nr:maleylpyruvate isomerase family mycothiol-dependent enzyme [Glutamicibacter sp.]
MSRASFTAAGHYLQEQMALLSTANLHRQSGCANWDEQHLINHVAQVANAVCETAGGAPFAVPKQAETIASTPKEAASSVEHALDLLESGPMLNMASIEFTAHGWDLGIGMDPQHRIPEELAEKVLELARGMLTDELRGSHFAPRRQVPESTNASDRLVAFLGRVPPGQANNQ